jgi:RNA recognition motif-containing protein
MIFHVRNLSTGATDNDVRGALESYGPIASVTLLKHQHTGAPLAVAVVDMPKPYEHQFLNSALVGVQIDASNIQAGPPRASSERRGRRDNRSLDRSARDRRTNDRRQVHRSDYRQ